MRAKSSRVTAIPLNTYTQQQCSSLCRIVTPCRRFLYSFPVRIIPLSYLLFRTKKKTISKKHGNKILQQFNKFSIIFYQIFIRVCTLNYSLIHIGKKLLGLLRMWINETEICSIGMTMQPSPSASSGKPQRKKEIGLIKDTRT